MCLSEPPISDRAVQGSKGGDTTGCVLDLTGLKMTFSMPRSLPIGSASIRSLNKVMHDRGNEKGVVNEHPHLPNGYLCAPSFEQHFLNDVGALGDGVGVVPRTSSPAYGVPALVDADVGQRFGFFLLGQAGCP